MRNAATRGITVVLAALALALISAVSALAAPAVNGIFKVKGVDTNSKIAAGSDGNMWVTIPGAAKNVARITPAGDVEEFELGLNGVTGIAAGPEGRLWLTSTETVTSFAPTNPNGTKASTPLAVVKEESPIVAGPEGNMWVATKNFVFEFLPSNPATKTEFPIAELSPKDIDVTGPYLAVSDSGPKNRIAIVNAAGFVGDIPIGGASQGLAGGPGGQLAFSVPGATPEQVGFTTLPNVPVFTELLGDPFGIALGADQAYWIAQFTPGGVTRMSMTGALTFVPGLPQNSPRQIAAGPGNTIWVTLSKNEEEGVARISGLEPPVPPRPLVVAPETKIGKGPKKVVKTFGKRAKVSFRFSSTTSSASFQCALAKAKKKGKKGKASAAPLPSFKACNSPRTYQLTPGKYRFAVRAVNAGVADPTAATFGFRVIRVHRRAHKSEARSFARPAYSPTSSIR